MPNFTLCRDHFQAQAKLSSVAKSNHLGATRVGAQIATQGAAALGGQAQGKQVACFFNMFLNRLQNTTRFGHHGEIGYIQRAHFVHSLQTQNHLLARFIGHRSNHQTGVATLRHDAHCFFGAGLHHCRHLLHIGRSHHSQGLAMSAFPPVLFPSAEIGVRVVVRQHVGIATNAAQVF